MSEQTFQPLTLKRAKELAAEVVADFGPEYIYTNPDGYSMDGAMPEGMEPDEVNENCYYVHDDDVPGCIVGHILHRHGVPLSTLRRHEDEGAGPVVEDLFSGESRRGRLAEYLIRLQSRQDNGFTWGDALDFANEPED